MLGVAVLEGGLSNKNYLVTVDGERFVVRVVPGAAGPIAMNRRREEDAARLASEAGINAELVFFLQPEGHLVVRYVDGSRPLE
jgi:aminoglycoside phosphotransferase (APT) family kinase protein